MLVVQYLGLAWRYHCIVGTASEMFLHGNQQATSPIYVTSPIREEKKGTTQPP